MNDKTKFIMEKLGVLSAMKSEIIQFAAEKGFYNGGLGEMLKNFIAVQDYLRSELPEVGE